MPQQHITMPDPYEVGVWIREHWDEIYTTLTDPVIIAAGIAALVVLVAAVAGVVRLAAGGYHAAARAIEIRPGAITVGVRRTKPLDFLLAIPVRQGLADRIHTEVVAPTRQAKTATLASWIEQDLEQGHTVTVIETAGDLGERSLEAAHDQSVPISRVDPSSPDTLGWNPLTAASSREVAVVAEHAVAALEVVGASTNPYYQAFNHVILRRMIHAGWALASSAGRQPDLPLIKRMVEDEEYLRHALRIDRDGAGRPRAGLENLDLTTRRWFEDRYLRWDREERERNTNGLYLALDELLSREEVAEALRWDPEKPCLDLRRALSQGGLILGSTSSAALGPVPAQMLAAWMLQTFMEKTLNRGGLNTPVIGYFDEFHGLLGGADTRAADSFAKYLPQVGKNGVAIVVAYQGLRMLPPNLRDVLAQNASNKFFSGRLSMDDAQAAQELLGRIETEQREVRQEGALLSGPRTTTVKREVEAPRYSIERIRRLRRGYWHHIRAEAGNLKEPVVVKARKPRR